MSIWLAAVIIVATIGAGVLSDWGDRHPGGRVDRLLGHDPGRQEPPTRPMALGDLVISNRMELLAAARARPLDPDPALGCPVCSAPFSAVDPCLCSEPCGDPGCGALAWGAVASTEEGER